MAKETMTLIDNRTGKRYEYPIIEGTRGPAAVDMRTFYRDSGMFSYDPGFTSTASCRSEITFINGEKENSATGGSPSRIWPRATATWRRSICCWRGSCPPTMNG